MSDGHAKEARTYSISGNLAPEQWQAVEQTLGRLGLSVCGEPNRENLLASEIISRVSFGTRAASAGYADVAISRSWNLLARVYAWEETAWRGEVPQPFRGILEYETVREEMADWGQKVDGLKALSFRQFMRRVDEAIHAAGSIKDARLPAGFGEYTVGLLRAVDQKTE